jgi:hypothetical protein
VLKLPPAHTRVLVLVYHCLAGLVFALILFHLPKVPAIIGTVLFMGYLIWGVWSVNPGACSFCGQRPAYPVFGDNRPERSLLSILLLAPQRNSGLQHVCADHVWMLAKLRAMPDVRNNE